MYLNKIQLALSPQTYLNKLSLYEKAGTVRWGAYLDGVLQYWNLSEPIVVPENADFRVGLTIIGERNTFEGLLEDDAGTSFWLRLMPDSQTNNLQGFVEGSYFSDVRHTDANLRDNAPHSIEVCREAGKFYMIYDGIKLTQPLEKNSGFKIDRIGRFSGTEFKGVIYDFFVEINGVRVNEIPLTNKTQGATQLATVGNVNALTVNYTEDVWRRLKSTN